MEYRTFNCIFCGKEKTLPKYRVKSAKYCSVVCSCKHRAILGLSGGDNSSLHRSIELYGEIKGAQKYNEKVLKAAIRLKGKPGLRKGMHWSKEDKERIRISSTNSNYTKNRRGKTFIEIYGREKLEALKKKMTGTFNLKWFIDKYGQQLGTQKYNERCYNLTQKSFFKGYNKTNKNNYSKISQELFWKLYNDTDLNLGTHTVYFGELNHEYGCNTNKNFDFVDKDSCKIIEYNGDNFHANPKIYKEDDTPNPYFKDLTSTEIWKLDEQKIENAKLKGFTVLVIWHSDYEKDKESVIKQCKEFLLTLKIQNI